MNAIPWATEENGPAQADSTPGNPYGEKVINQLSMGRAVGGLLIFRAMLSDATFGNVLYVLY